MKISQIKTLYKEKDVNEWLLKNHHLEIVNISFVIEGIKEYYLIHYKINAELVSE